MPKKERLERWSTITLVITVVLFAISVFVTGFTHELLLEVGVFLVSMKLVLNSSKAALAIEKIDERLNAIQVHLEQGRDSGEAPVRRRS